MKNGIPSLYEIVQISAVAGSLRAGLSKEYRQAQAELNEQFSGIETGGGICIPWGSRCLSARESERENGRAGLHSQQKSAKNGAEHRDMTATGGGGNQGGMTIAHDVPEIGSALRANLVLEAMGARVFGGLRGNVGLPRASASLSAEWLSENADASETDELFSLLDLEPHRITAYIDVSDQLLKQGEAIEAFLRAELMSAIAVEFQRVAIAGTGLSNQPLGIVNTPGIGNVAGGTNGAAPTNAHLTALEFAVTGTAKANRGNLGWLASPLVRKKLRETPIFASGSVPVWSAEQADSLFGHPAGVTPSVPDNLTKGSATGVASALIFGEMSELMLGVWGPGILVETLRDRAGAIAGQTRLYGSAYVDSGVRSPEAFAAMKDALCA